MPADLLYSSAIKVYLAFSLSWHVANLALTEYFAKPRKYRRLIFDSEREDESSGKQVSFGLRVFIH